MDNGIGTLTKAPPDRVFSTNRTRTCTFDGRCFTDVVSGLFDLVGRAAIVDDGWTVTEVHTSADGFTRQRVWVPHLFEQTPRGLPTSGIQWDLAEES